LDRFLARDQPNLSSQEYEDAIAAVEIFEEVEGVGMEAKVDV
jgi:hypothetical protein